jgi:hypothetical protein
MTNILAPLIVLLCLNCSFHSAGAYDFHIATFPDIKEWGPGDPFQNLLEVYVSNPPGFFPDSNSREVIITLYKSANPKATNLLTENYIIIKECIK